MKEQLISFETAKLAKEKGFEQKHIDNHYKDDSQLCITGLSYTNGLSLGAAPTQSLLQKWLREEHALHISIDSIGGRNGYFYSILEVISGSGACEESVKETTYEKALEKGLQEALKLIQL